MRFKNRPSYFLSQFYVCGANCDTILLFAYVHYPAERILRDSVLGCVIDLIEYLGIMSDHSQHLTPCPGEISRRAGVSRRHWGLATGQRGQKPQPGSVAGRPDRQVQLSLADQSQFLRGTSVCYGTQRRMNKSIPP